MSLRRWLAHGRYGGLRWRLYLWLIGVVDEWDRRHTGGAP